MDKVLGYEIRDDEGTIESATNLEDLMSTWENARTEVGDWAGDLVLVAVLARQK